MAFSSLWKWHPRDAVKMWTWYCNTRHIPSNNLACTIKFSEDMLRAICFFYIFIFRWCILNHIAVCPSVCLSVCQLCKQWLKKDTFQNHYTPCRWNWGRHTGFSLSVHLSFRPSVCRWNCVHFVSYNISWIHFIFSHLINQLQKVCCVFQVSSLM